MHSMLVTLTAGRRAQGGVPCVGTEKWYRVSTGRLGCIPDGLEWAETCSWETGEMMICGRCLPSVIHL